MVKRLSDNIFSKNEENLNKPPCCFIIQRKNRFILFSAVAGIVIWFATFTVLVSYTDIALIYNKLISILAVLTFWFIKWYRNVRQYLHDSKRENGILIKLRAILKYAITEILHFIILISVLLILMFFTEKYF
jgi:hypothetical protein